MKDLVIFGTGAFASIAKIYFDQAGKYKTAAFTVDANYCKASEHDGLPLVPFEDLARQYDPDRCDLFVAVAYNKMNRIRAEKVQAAKQAGYRLPSYVSPKAEMPSPVSIGENSFIFEQNVLLPFSKIGNNVVLWTGNIIGHHVQVEDHTFITCNVILGGRAKAGQRCFFGFASIVRDGVSVADDTFVGPQALILRDTKAGEVYAIPGTQPRKNLRSSDLRSI